MASQRSTRRSLPLPSRSGDQGDTERQQHGGYRKIGQQFQRSVDGPWQRDSGEREHRADGAGDDDGIGHQVFDLQISPSRRRGRRS